MYFICDDISARYENHLHKLETLRTRNPEFKVTCFVIAQGLTVELVRWLQQDWIEVAVHGFMHDEPPECERSDKAERIELATSILRPLLPEIFGFRAPGFQMTATTYPILRRLGYSYLAHQTNVQLLERTGHWEPNILVNTHIYEALEYDFEKDTSFTLISEGCHFNHYSDILQSGLGEGLRGQHPQLHANTLRADLSPGGRGPGGRPVNHRLRLQE